MRFLILAVLLASPLLAESDACRVVQKLFDNFYPGKKPNPVYAKAVIPILRDPLQHKQLEKEMKIAEKTGKLTLPDGCTLKWHAEKFKAYLEAIRKLMAEEDKRVGAAAARLLSAIVRRRK